MEASPLFVLGLSSAFAGALLLGGASHWAMERRTRLRRVRAATGKRLGRVTAAGAKPAKNTQMQQSALAMMRASTGRLAILKGGALSQTKKLLVSAGYRSRDAIVVYTFFKLVMPLVFLGGAALYRLRPRPDRQGSDLRRRRGDGRGARSAASCPTSSSRTSSRSASTACARACPTRSTCWSSAPRPAFRRTRR